MSKFSNRVLYGRGLNIAAQLHPHRNNIPHFTPIDAFTGVPLKKIGCGYLQSYYFLNDGQFIKAGYFMDSLTSIRLINLHRLVSFAIPTMQKMTFLGRVLSFRGGDEIPTLFNGKVEDYFQDVVFGGCRVFGLGQKQVHGMGENYFGQLGTRNIMNFEHTFTVIPRINNEKIIGVGCGFQHTLFITNNSSLYGCGKASDYQIQPLKYAQKNDLTDKIEVPQLMMRGETIRKAAGGLKFSLIWTEKNKIYAVGDNRFGQCGQNNILYPEVKKLTEVLFEWQKGQEIIDIACGFCHSLILTNKYVYFFGSIEQNQNPFKTFDQHICAPTPLPIDNPRKIFANFDRSAIVTQSGQALIFGGRDYKYCGGESGQLQILEGFGQQSEIGLGFAHTLIYP